MHILVPVIKTGSRINHRYVHLAFFLFLFIWTIFFTCISVSCMPNIKMDFSIPSFSFQCYAIIDIKARELFYGLGYLQNKSARRQSPSWPCSLFLPRLHARHTSDRQALQTEYWNIYIGKDFIINRKMITSNALQRARLSRWCSSLIKRFHFTSEN